jgi:hypothetical protein
VAQYLGYKSPTAKRHEALENTRRMFDMIKGFEAVEQKAKDSVH